MRQSPSSCANKSTQSTGDRLHQWKVTGIRVGPSCALAGNEHPRDAISSMPTFTTQVCHVRRGGCCRPRVPGWKYAHAGRKES
eukprot:scaffold511234_cov52-Prasinocladus_malaysianus.AAC.1